MKERFDLVLGSLMQGMANQGLLPAFINKILLETAIAIPYIVYGSFCAPIAGLNCSQRNCVVCKTYLLSGPLKKKKKGADLCMGIGACLEDLMVNSVRRLFLYNERKKLKVLVEGKN